MTPILLQSITSEQLLHYIWRTKQFDRTQLRLTDGTPVEIFDFGRYNANSGPDFQHAKIRIGTATLAGHIEMHILSSEWDMHNHQVDPAYNNVILHVVARHDKEITTLRGHSLPTLELPEYLDEGIVRRYNLLKDEVGMIPCYRLRPGMADAGVWNIWKERLNIERLQSRVSWIEQGMEALVQDWDAIFFHQMIVSMGTNVNKDAFTILADHLDYSIFQKIRHDDIALHAYMMGMAGLLQRDDVSPYYKRLTAEYQYLEQKYAVEPLNPVIWKYAKMHPSNFPDIRIAQVTELFRINEHLFSTALECKTIKALKKMLNVVDLPVYWQYHYKAGNRSKPQKKTLGDTMKMLLIINGIIPLMFHYGRVQNKMEYQDRAFNLIEQIPAEDNYITRMWRQLDVACNTALDSQALIQLKTKYCDMSKCLQCSIGHELLRGGEGRKGSR